MKRFGLIGSNIGHSGSPELFRRAYDGQWPYELLEGTDFQVLWKRFLDSYQGVNVTAPFKEKAYEQIVALTADGLGAITGPAMKAGAVNLAVKTDDGILGDNTDFSAVILSTAEVCFPGITREFLSEFGASFHVKVHKFFRQKFDELYPGGGQALVVGCGGAGRAAAVAAAELGYDVMLLNRTQEKAAGFALSRQEYGFAVCPAQELKNAVKSCDLIIYAASGAAQELTSLQAEDFVAIPGHCSKIVIEANYKEPSFKASLLDKIALAGATYVPGQNWLLLQALAGYSTLTGALPKIF